MDTVYLFMNLNNIYLWVIFIFGPDYSSRLRSENDKLVGW